MEKTVISNRRLGVVPGAFSIVIAASLLAAEESPAKKNWGQWRGPEGTGVAPLADPPAEWAEGKGVRWKVAIPGSGTASPIVWGDLVFIQTAVPAGDAGAKEAEKAKTEPEPEGKGRRGRRGGSRAIEKQKFLLLAIDRKSGETRWTAVAREVLPHEGHHGDHGFASASPVTDGEGVYAFFGSQGLYAFDMKGEKRWDVDFGDKKMRNGFGEGSSPALHGDTIIVNWDHQGGSFIVTVDKKSGKTLWRKDREEESSWTTPLVVEADGRAQVIVEGTNRTRSYDLKTGDLVWECSGMTANVIPTPVAGFGRVYVTSGFRGNSLQAITLDRKGDLSKTDAIAWSLGRATPYVPSPLLHGDRLYFISGNNAIISCHDARSGEAIFAAHRLESLSGVYASPVAAAGKIYVVGRNGTTVVLAADGTSPRVLATNTLDDRIDASPALVEREIYLRGHRSLYCIIKEEGTGEPKVEKQL